MWIGVVFFLFELLPFLGTKKRLYLPHPLWTQSFKKSSTLVMRKKEKGGGQETGLGGNGKEGKRTEGESKRKQKRQKGKGGEGGLT